jgi:hypothetical protein
MTINQKQISKPNSGLKKILISRGFIVLISIFLFIIVPILLAVFVFNPSVIRSPKVAHHHFRMQLYIDDAYVNFSESQFQESYDLGQCDGSLTNTPIHFHDKKDQFVHIHWKNITGGQVLKYYGLNRIDIIDDYMGITFKDGWNKPQLLKIHGKAIPQTSKNLYVYQVKDGEAILREKDDFLFDDLESFFGVKSSLTEAQEEEENSFFEIRGLAHREGGDKIEVEIKSEQTTQTEAKITSIIDSEGNTTIIEDSQNPDQSSVSIQKTQEELKKLNDVIGDVIVFVQDSEPTKGQVESKLDDFVTLESSTCGG